VAHGPALRHERNCADDPPLGRDATSMRSGVAVDRAPNGRSGATGRSDRSTARVAIRNDLRCTLLLAVTAKEKLLKRAPHWSEEQAERALRAAESDGAVDEWGDLSQLHEVSVGETMRRLAKEEQAAGHKPW
jgi:hypothetical protein